MNTNIQCIHTYNAYMHTYKYKIYNTSTLIHTYMHTYMHACIHIYTYNMYIHTYIHTYTHTTNSYIYIHTYIQLITSSPWKAVCLHMAFIGCRIFVDPSSSSVIAQEEEVWVYRPCHTYPSQHDGEDDDQQYW